MRWLISVTCFVTGVALCAEPITPLPRDVQQAIHNRLSGPNMGLGALKPSFVRYSPEGKVETFGCQYGAAYRLYAYRSDGGGIVSVGECKKDAVLNERYADIQAEAFKTAVGDRSLGLSSDLFRPRIARSEGKTTIYLVQLLASGAGGAGGHGAVGLETVLIVPTSGQQVFLAQGTRPGNCVDGDTLEACSAFPKLLEDLAELVQQRQARKRGP